MPDDGPPAHIRLDEQQILDSSSVRRSRRGLEHVPPVLGMKRGHDDADRSALHLKRQAGAPRCRRLGRRLLLIVRELGQDLGLPKREPRVARFFVERDDHVLDLVAPQQSIALAPLEPIPDGQKLLDAVLADAELRSASCSGGRGQCLRAQRSTY